MRRNENDLVRRLNNNISGKEKSISLNVRRVDNNNNEFKCNKVKLDNRETDNSCLRKEPTNLIDPDYIKKKEERLNLNNFEVVFGCCGYPMANEIENFYLTTENGIAYINFNVIPSTTDAYIDKFWVGEEMPYIALKCYDKEKSRAIGEYLIAHHSKVVEQNWCTHFSHDAAPNEKFFYNVKLRITDND